MATVVENLTRIFHQLVRKNGQGLDWPKVFLIDCNKMFHRKQKIIQAIKNQARPQQLVNYPG